MLLARKLLALLLVALLLPTSAFAQKILRYSEHEPLGGMRIRFIKDVFFAAVEKESKGRLKVEDRWDSAVSARYDALRTVGDGKVTDMAIVVSEYTARELPLTSSSRASQRDPAGTGRLPSFAARTPRSRHLRRNSRRTMSWRYASEPIIPSPSSAPSPWTA